ncbi:MAG: signal peptidase II [Bradymonadales bacterium]|nr:signal peptidase II [Bradymonadales bacterium]
MKKYLLLAVVVVLSLGADLLAKHLAKTRLASEAYQHFLLFDVPPDGAGTTVGQFLEEEFSLSSPEVIQQIAAHSTDILDRSGAVLRTGNLENHLLEGGETLQVRNRSLTVVDGFLDFRYVENKGAAWGFLSDQDASFRQPFFIIVGLLAIGVVFLLYRTTSADRTLFLISLALILGGALGNISDRIRYRYVVDMIHCRPGFEYPTFNVADAWIVIGVGLMIIQVIRERVAHRKGRKVEAEIG